MKGKAMSSESQKKKTISYRKRSPKITDIVIWYITFMMKHIKKVSKSMLKEQVIIKINHANFKSI